MVGIDNTESRTNTRVCYHSLDAGCPQKTLTTLRSRISICKETPKWLISTQKPVQDVSWKL